MGTARENPERELSKIEFSQYKELLHPNPCSAIDTAEESWEKKWLHVNSLLLSNTFIPILAIYKARKTTETELSKIEFSLKKEHLFLFFENQKQIH